MDKKKIIIITGYYGTGKTNIAINLAVDYSNLYKTVIVDLDIVNPYYRSSDRKDVFESHGIKLISPTFASTNLDIPALPGEINSVFSMDYEVIVFDVGGDDAGAVALGRYNRKIKENGYEMYCVVSKYRPFIDNPFTAVQVLKEIEGSSRLRMTGIINNSNLGAETTNKDIINSLEYADKISEMTGLPIIYTTVKNHFPDDKKINNLRKIDIYTKSMW